MKYPRFIGATLQLGWQDKVMLENWVSESEWYSPFNEDYEVEKNHCYSWFVMFNRTDQIKLQYFQYILANVD